MKYLKYFYISVFSISLFTITSCNPDEVPMEEPVELITTLNYILTPIAGGDTVAFSFMDIDGDGGNAPTITSGTLAANTTYSASITLLNESEDPIEDITEEVQAEAEDHQFFFEVSGADLTWTYSDADAKNNPIGLATAVSTGGASSGTLTITLRHQPDKDAAGVADGDISNAGGETDIEVSFPVVIQ